jgi:hypothetical protein
MGTLARLGNIEEMPEEILNKKGFIQKSSQDL